MKIFGWSIGGNSKNLTNEKTQDISWSSIVGHVFRVLEFDRAGTTMDSSGRITPVDDFSPYGYLLVESPTYKLPFKLQIVHRDDFFLATTFFDDPNVLKQFKDMDLLVTYIPEYKTADGRIGISHALHYNITLKGILEQYYKNESHLTNPEPGKIFGKFIYHGEIKIGTNFNPSLY